MVVANVLAILYREKWDDEKYGEIFFFAIWSQNVGRGTERKKM